MYMYTTFICLHELAALGELLLPDLALPHIYYIILYYIILYMIFIYTRLHELAALGELLLPDLALLGDGQLQPRQLRLGRLLMPRA